MPHIIDLALAPSDQQPDELTSEELAALASSRLDGLPIATARLLRFSFDARRRVRRWQVKLEAFEPDEEVTSAFEVPAPIAAPESSAKHVVVIGSGPAGLVASIELLRAGLRVTLLERGFDVQRRRKDLASIHRGVPVDADSNYCHGEGGAGTYSDGKLYTRSGDGGDVRGVLELLVAHGAPDSILSDWRPHIGSNRLPKVVAAISDTIRAGGGEVRFGARAIELETRAASGGEEFPEVTGVVVETRSADPDDDSRRTETLACDAVILATGHSALDALAMAGRAGAVLEAKGFAMGLRVEHPQPWLDELQYGGLRGPASLPAAFYELVTERKGRGVYSFCMCPGGFIVPASTGADRMVVNGMSLSRRDSPFANSGIVVAIEPEDLCGGKGLRWGAAKLLRAAIESGGDPFGAAKDLIPTAERLADGWLPDEPRDEPLVGIVVQRALELEAALWGGGDNCAPAQRADDFIAGAGGVTEPLETSYQAGLTGVDLARLLPRGLSERLRRGVADFDERLRGFGGKHGQVVGVESRTSSPARIPRESDTREAIGLRGLFPAGEGAGYAGGIVSAAIDGGRVARGVVLRLGVPSQG